jgi:large subunit ribosomal protein L19e
MSIKTVRRLAADLLKCGEGRIVLNPTESKKIEEALTREDVRSLINSGVITRKQKRGVSRRKARERHAQKKKGRSRGHGVLRGKKYSRLSQKDAWMARVRAQRALLKKMLEEGKIEGNNYRTAYRMIKGGAFKGKAQLTTHLKDAGMLKG